jgi:hypothetical protein
VTGPFDRPLARLERINERILERILERTAHF